MTEEAEREILMEHLQDETNGDFLLDRTCDPSLSLLRNRLQWNRMGPIEKYRRNKKFLSKVIIRLVKLILCTIQAFIILNICSEIFFMERRMTKQTVDLFNSKHSIHTRQELADLIRLSFENFEEIDQFYINRMIKNNSFYQICYKLFKINHDVAESDNYRVGQNCIKLTYKSVLEFHVQNIVFSDMYFDLVEIVINIQLTNKYYCHENLPYYKIHVTFAISSTISDFHSSGILFPQIQVNTLKIHVLDRPSLSFLFKKSAWVFFLNIFQVVLSSISLFLCVRSLVSRYKLYKLCDEHFTTNKNHKMNWDERFEFLDVWLIIFFIDDVLSIIVNFHFIIILFRFEFYNNFINFGIGLNSFFAWIGILRYFIHFSSFNFLLLIIKCCMPAVFRFLSCTIIIFIPCMLCAYCTLGPYNEKFSSLWRVSAILFAMMNGDELSTTFESLNRAPLIISLFSKVFLSCFIFFFMYVVISIFVAIINDYTHNETDNDNMISQFIHECECAYCSLDINRHSNLQAD